MGSREKMMARGVVDDLEVSWRPKNDARRDLLSR